MPRPLIFLSLVAWAVAGLVVAQTFLDSTGWGQRRNVARDIETASQQRAMLSADVQRLRDTLTSLQEEKTLQEQVVRDELDYARPGDLIITGITHASANTKP